MPTTEEMNRVIDAYMGIIDVPVFTTFPLAIVGYHESWDKLMPVWDRLRNELRAGASSKQNKVYAIVDAIGYRTIAEAHRLIYEDIVWLNQNKTT